MNGADSSRVSIKPWGICGAALMLVCWALAGCNGGGGSGNNDNGSDTQSDTSANAQDASNPQDSSDTGSNTSSNQSSDIGSNDPNTLAAIGDSITAGSEIAGPSYPSRLSGILGKRVLNRGVPGAYSSAAGGHAVSALGAKPAYLLMMYGTNDVFQEIPSSTVASNVRNAVLAAKSNRTIPVVATIPPNLRSDFQNGLVASINSRLKAMASSEGARVADVNREFGSGEGLMNSDGYHPNETGTQIIAFAFADAVR